MSLGPFSATQVHTSSLGACSSTKPAMLPISEFLFFHKAQKVFAFNKGLFDQISLTQITPIFLHDITILGRIFYHILPQSKGRLLYNGENHWEWFLEFSLSQSDCGLSNHWLIHVPESTLSNQVFQECCWYFNWNCIGFIWFYLFDIHSFYFKMWSLSLFIILSMNLAYLFLFYF